MPSASATGRVAHDVVRGVGGAGTVARFAADLDLDRHARRRLAGAVTAEAARLGLRPRTAIACLACGVRLPRRELLRVTAPHARAPGPVAPAGVRRRHETRRSDAANARWAKATRTLSSAW